MTPWDSSSFLTQTEALFSVLNTNNKSIRIRHLPTHPFNNHSIYQSYHLSNVYFALLQNKEFCQNMCAFLCNEALTHDWDTFWFWYLFSIYSQGNVEVKSNLRRDCSTRTWEHLGEGSLRKNGSGALMINWNKNPAVHFGTMTHLWYIKGAYGRAIKKRKRRNKGRFDTTGRLMCLCAQKCDDVTLHLEAADQRCDGMANANGALPIRSDTVGSSPCKQQVAATTLFTQWVTNTEENRCGRFTKTVGL